MWSWATATFEMVSEGHVYALFELFNGQWLINVEDETSIAAKLECLRK